MSFVTATTYGGRLHLGYGEENSVAKCLGDSVNIYSNFISKFLAFRSGLKLMEKIVL